MKMTNWKDLYQNRREAVISDYYKLLRFPSISSEPGYKQDLLACADWLVNFLQEMGFETELWETTGHPVIFASHLKAGPNKPTVLIYNHYDVQPVDPLEKWDTPPFEPTDKGGVIYARGAQDNKGQCTYVLQALKALIETEHELPLNVKLCIEGEEETGSSGLSSILQSKKKQLQADYLVIADLDIRKPGVPAVTLGIRGIVTMEVEVHSSSIDLHSGTHGGVVYNPIHALNEILSKLRDRTGRIAVPGFYDDVEEFDANLRERLALDFDETAYREHFGASPTGGEKQYTPFERAWTRPTIEVNGIIGGYTGPGFKTVIPGAATAKVSCRLVPNQDPQKIGRLVANFIEQQAPEGVTVKVTLNPGGGMAVRAHPGSKAVEAFSKAYSEVFSAPCEYILEGGSIPIVTELSAASGGDVVLMGVGLHEDMVHAPNEHFGLDRLEQGFLVMIHALQNLGGTSHA